MMNKGWIASLVLFVIVTATVLIFWNRLAAAGIAPWVVLGGNSLLLFTTLLSMYMNAKAMQHRNTHGFIRNVYGGFLLKFIIIVVASVAYISVVKTPDKNGLLVCAALYLLYTFFGTRTVLNHKTPVINGNGKSIL